MLVFSIQKTSLFLLQAETMAKKKPQTNNLVLNFASPGSSWCFTRKTSPPHLRNVALYDFSFDAIVVLMLPLQEGIYKTAFS